MAKKRTTPREAGPFWFDGGPLPVQVCYAPDAAAWDYAMGALGLGEPWPHDRPGGRCTTFESPKLPELAVVISWQAREDASTASIVGIIAHEANHAVRFILDHMEAYNPSHSRHFEVEAYLQQWITQNVFNAWREYAGHKKREQALTKARKHIK